MAFPTMIDSSTGAQAVVVMPGLFDFTIYVDRTKYKIDEIEDAAEIDAEAYRSAGRAAVGAVVGGLLTGGLGFLAGAALGGRRRVSASYFLKFRDGNYVAFTTTNKKDIQLLAPVVRKYDVRRMAAGG